MSSSDNNITFKKTSFLSGINSEFINEYYSEYLSDPNSVPEGWRKFFEGLSENEKLVLEDLKGPSWSPERKIKKVNISFIEDKIRREFAAMAVSLDDGVGRILATLEETELAEDTLLIFLTDHGGDPVYGGSNTPLRGNKATLFEGGLKVPCVMRWPGKIRAGSVSDDVVCSLDLCATFCELAGADSGSTDGTSLVSHLQGRSNVPPRDLLWQTGSHAELNRGQWTAFRRGPLKYLQDSNGTEYLFDLKADPNEAKDLSQSRPQQLKQLRDAARKRIEELRP